MNERDALLAMVCQRPFCGATKLVFADWLEEHGECGEAIRWAVRNRRRPINSTQRDVCWGWWWGLASAHIVRGTANSLPDCLMFGPDGLKRDRESQMYRHWRSTGFDTQDKAWNAFIVAFAAAHAQGKIGRRRKTKP
jgi:uncharacterized protein (TIGR02996 family)